jgi:hypothetical protein
MDFDLALPDPNLDFLQLQERPDKPFEPFDYEFTDFAAYPHFSPDFQVSPDYDLSPELDLSPDYDLSPDFSDLSDPSPHLALDRPAQLDPKLTVAHPPSLPLATRHSLTPETGTPDSRTPESEATSHDAAPRREVTGHDAAERREAPAIPPPKRGRRSKKQKPISEAERRSQRERFLERNRNAAAKCRINKKHWQESLKDTVKDLQGRHRQLQRELAQLSADFDGLRVLSVAHVQQCRDERLEAWIAKHAERLVEVLASAGVEAAEAKTAVDSTAESADPPADCPPDCPPDCPA